MDWPALSGNYDLIREHIERTIPGFDGYNSRVRVPGGFYLPHPVRDTTTFHTETQKARFFTGKISQSAASRGHADVDDSAKS